MKFRVLLVCSVFVFFGCDDNCPDGFLGDVGENLDLCDGEEELNDPERVSGVWDLRFTFGSGRFGPSDLEYRGVGFRQGDHDVFLSLFPHAVSKWQGTMDGSTLRLKLSTKLPNSTPINYDGDIEFLPELNALRGSVKWSYAGRDIPGFEGRCQVSGSRRVGNPVPQGEGMTFRVEWENTVPGQLSLYVVTPEGEGIENGGGYSFDCAVAPKAPYGKSGVEEVRCVESHVPHSVAVMNSEGGPTRFTLTVIYDDGEVCCQESGRPLVADDIQHYTISPD